MFSRQEPMYQGRLSNQPKNSENNVDVGPTSNKYEGVIANNNGSDQDSQSEYEYDIIPDCKPDTSNTKSCRQVPHLHL